MDEQQSLGTIESLPEIQPPRASVGKILRQAREKAGISIADASRQLKLGARQIESLEADDFGRLPSPTFVRGFIRNYARLLEVDAQPILEAYQQTGPQSREQVIVPSERQVSFSEHSRAIPKKYLVAFAAIALVAGAGALYEFTPLKNVLVLPHLEEPAPAVTQTTTPAAPNQESARLPEPSQAEPLPLPAAAPGSVTPPPPAPQAQEPQPSVGAASPAATASPAPNGVELSFGGDSWVEVRERGGRVVYAQLNHANNRQTIQGTPPLDLTIGNASAVKVSYKGQPVDLAGSTNQANVAHLKLD